MKKLSLRIIISIFTFLIGFSAVLFCLYYNQKGLIKIESEITEIEPVQLIDNNDVHQSESFPGLSEDISKLRSKFPPKENRNKYGTVGLFMNDWYGSFLKAMGEKSLLKVSINDTEVYRFLWLRTFDHPVFVRVEKEKIPFNCFLKKWTMMVVMQLERFLEK